jgi:hypothetical protein
VKAGLHISVIETLVNRGDHTMKTMMTKATSAVATAILVGVGLTIAGLSLGAFVFLALFGLAAAALALLAAPVAEFLMGAEQTEEAATQTTAQV